MGKLTLENISDLGERCLYLKLVVREELEGIAPEETIVNIQKYIFEELFKDSCGQETLKGRKDAK